MLKMVVTTKTMVLVITMDAHGLVAGHFHSAIAASFCDGGGMQTTFTGN